LDPAQDDIGSPILQCLGVADQSCAADRVDRGRLLDIVTPPLEQDHADDPVSAQRIGQHLAVARLEDVQRQEY